MGRYNTPVKNRTGSSPLKTVSGTSYTRTATGGTGFVSDKHTETYRLGVNLLAGGEETFHEGGKARDNRFNSLVSSLALGDPTWVQGFLPWLRGPEANIRTAPLLGTVAAVHARLNSTEAKKEDELLSSLGHMGLNRHLASTVPSRADEIGELISMYISAHGSRGKAKLPMSFKRGLGDAANRLWNEYSVLKYDTASHNVRFSDVLNLTHAVPAPGNEDLFSYIIANRYGKDFELGGLRMIRENIQLRKDAANDASVLLNPSRLKAAGFTWEDALSLAGNRVNKGELWSALILAGMVPIFATLRNLRNFDEAGISNQAKEAVHKQLTNPEVISKSRILPFRFLTAIEQLSSYTWHSDLETAVQLAAPNVPVMPGKTAIVVDTSGSMDVPISNKSKMTRSGLAGFFGGLLAAKNAGSVSLFIYADGVQEIPVKRGVSALKLAQEMHGLTGRVGHGTQTGMALRHAYQSNPDAVRIVNFTDMQCFAHGRQGLYGFDGTTYGNRYAYSYNSNFNRTGAGADVPDKVHLYSFDLAGYKASDISAGDGRTHQLGGMSDATLRWMPLIERGAECDWPWVNRG